MWCRQKVQWGILQNAKTSRLAQKKIGKAALFTYIGLDYIGPFYVKENKVKKVWICIFICVTIPALNLEIVDDMTTE